MTPQKLLAASSAALLMTLLLAPAAGANTEAGNLPAQKWFADAGLLTQITSDVTGLGFNIRGGRYIGAADRLTLDIGATFDLDPKTTGRFSYYRESDHVIRNDGKIEIKHTLVPVLFGWQHEWQTKSGRFAFDFGPTIGAMFVSAKEERNPRVNNASNVLRSDSGTAFAYGVTASMRWNLMASNNRLYLDCSLAALGATKVKLDKFKDDPNLSGGRLVVAVGYRF